MEIMKDDIEKALRVANYIKDQAKKLKGKVRNYSGIRAALESELYIDGGVVKTRLKDSSKNSEKKYYKSLSGFTYTHGGRADPIPPIANSDRGSKELIINTNGQNTRVKRRSSVAQLRRSSQGSSLSSSGFNVGTEPRKKPA